MKKWPISREEQAFLFRGLPAGQQEVAPAGGEPEFVAEVAGSETSDRAVRRAATDVPEHLETRWRQTGLALADEFSISFRAACAVELQRQGRCTLGQYLLGCDEATCLFRLPLADGDQPAWLTLELPLALALLDRLLGGPLAPRLPAARPLTELERRFAARIAAACIRALGAVWPSMQFAPVPADAVCRVELPWLVSKSHLAFAHLHLRLGESGGRLSLAIPWNQTLSDPAVAADASHTIPALRPVRFTAVLARIKVLESDLQNLGVGDLIPTQQAADQALEIEIDGHVRHRAGLGSRDGHKAIRIQ